MKPLQLVYVCQVDRDLFEGLQTSISETTLHLANGSYRHVASAHVNSIADVYDIFSPSAFGSNKEYMGLTNRTKRILKAEVTMHGSEEQRKNYQHPQVIVHSPMRPLSITDVLIVPNLPHGFSNWFLKTRYGLKLFATSEDIDSSYLQWVREHLKQMQRHSMTETEAYDWEIPLTYETINSIVWHPEKLGDTV